MVCSHRGDRVDLLFWCPGFPTMSTSAGNGCRKLGLPIAVHKTEVPALVLIFLGIELDSRSGIMAPGRELKRESRERLLI